MAGSRPSEQVDVVIVGARCAGASLAIHLARAGLSVVVVDRAKRGSDKLSTLYIHQPGVQQLRNLGVPMGDTLAGAPAMDTLTFHAEGVELQGRGPVCGDGNVAYAPRRSDLDELLCSRAETAGATVVHEARATGLLADEERITGICFRTSEGDHLLGARLVVGADGLRSTVAEKVQARTYLERPKASICYYGFFEGLDDPFSQFQGGRRWVGVIPTAGAHLIAAYLPQGEFTTAKANPQAAFRHTLAEVDARLYAKVMDASQAERLIGMGDQRNYYRAASGPGWALIGDAGHHKDSLTAQGITDALVQSAMLAGELAQVPIDDPDRVDQATREFERKRDEESLARYYSTLAVARLQLDPTRKAMLEAIASSPQLCDLYASAVAGVTTPAAFHARLAEHGVDADR